MVLLLASLYVCLHEAFKREHDYRYDLFLGRPLDHPSKQKVMERDSLLHFFSLLEKQSRIRGRSLSRYQQLFSNRFESCLKLREERHQLLLSYLGKAFLLYLTIVLASFILHGFHKLLDDFFTLSGYVSTLLFLFSYGGFIYLCPRRTWLLDKNQMSSPSKVWFSAFLDGTSRSEILSDQLAAREKYSGRSLKMEKEMRLKKLAEDGEGKILYDFKVFMNFFPLFELVCMGASAAAASLSLFEGL